MELNFPYDKAITLYTVEVLHYTLYIKNGMLGQGRKAVKMLKTK